MVRPIRARGCCLRKRRPARRLQEQRERRLHVLLERLEPSRPHGAVDHAVVARERDLVLGLGLRLGLGLGIGLGLGLGLEVRS